MYFILISAIRHQGPSKLLLRVILHTYNGFSGLNIFANPGASDRMQATMMLLQKNATGNDANITDRQKQVHKITSFTNKVYLKTLKQQI